MSVPQLRFNDKNGLMFPSWKHTLLGDVATFTKGKGLSKSDIDENGATPCIRYGELYTEYGETIRDVKSKTNANVSDLVFSKSNDVIIPASGETQIDIATASCVQLSGVALGGDLNIIRSNQDGVFLSYYLNSQKKLAIAKLAQGNSVVHLYARQLKLLDLHLPTKSEQTKIVNFLTVVDEKISQLTRKYDLLTQYKKGVMQQIFSQELRFKDDDGRKFPEWEVKSLGAITSFIKDGTHGTHTDTVDGEYLLLSAKNIKDGGIYFDDSDRRISKEEFDSIYKNYKLYDGDVLLSVVGTIGRVAVYSSAFNNVAFQRSVAFFRFESANSRFISQLFTANKFQNDLLTNQVVSAQPGIYLGDLAKIKIKLPSLPEQIKIANFLTSIDDKISNAQAQLEAVKQYKQGLLQQMFV